MKNPHSFKSITIKGTASFPWPVCSKCGLVALKNWRSANAAVVSCDG